MLALIEHDDSIDLGDEAVYLGFEADNNRELMDTLAIINLADIPPQSRAVIMADGHASIGDILSTIGHQR